MRAAVFLVPFALSAAFAAAAACGARTELYVDLPGPDGTRPDAATDAEPDAPGDAADGSVDAAPDAGPCTTDADCGEELFCSSARCYSVLGCVRTPRDCDDGIDCTKDTCDEAKKSCEHTLDDALCPDTELCSPKRGCAPFVYAVASDGNLYEVGVPSGQLTVVGASQAFSGDIALTPDGTLYTTDSYILYRTNRSDAATKAVGSILPLQQYNGLGSQPDGTLQATAEVPEVFSVDTMTAAAAPLASLPAGYRASGDLTSAGGQLLVTLTSSNAPTTDSLGVVDAASGTTSVIGDIGFSCVWGLATLGGVVYGFTCHGLILVIDPATGVGTQVAQAQPAFFGAAGR